MSFDLKGQGEPLPLGYACIGEWILHPRMFLYVSAEPSTHAPSVPQFTPAINAGRNDWSFGFDALVMATAFEITIDELRDANKSGELTLENVLANTPDGEGATKKLYLFGYRGKVIELAVEYLSQAGTA